MIIPSGECCFFILFISLISSLFSFFISIISDFLFLSLSNELIILALYSVILFAIIWIFQRAVRKHMIHKISYARYKKAKQKAAKKAEKIKNQKKPEKQKPQPPVKKK